MTAQIDNLIAIAKAEVGYHEGRSASGSWNNQEKYAGAVPGLEWANGQAWCATFVSWCAMKAGVGDLFPSTASTDTGASWFKSKGQWSEVPSVGAQVFYGSNGDMNHTGLVYDFDDTYIYTVEGNTNSNGSREGDGVYLKKRARRDSYVQGYGHPAFAPEKPVEPRVEPAKPRPTPKSIQKIRDLLTAQIKDKPKNQKRVQKLRKSRNDLPKN